MVVIGLKVTLLADLTWRTLLVFNVDLGDLVDMLDTDECDEFVVAIVSNDARFQLCIFGLLSGLKRPFLTSCKRAQLSVSDFPWNLSRDRCFSFSLTVGLEA